jgi:membrane fusion protein (multidrug efflux system)
VKVGASQNNQWVILSGLQPGEQVIADGFQKMMVPGAAVKTVPWTPGGMAAGAASAAKAAPAAPAAPAASAAK